MVCRLEYPSLNSPTCICVSVCVLVSERVSENSCDCKICSEVRPRCVSVGDDRAGEGMEGMVGGGATDLTSLCLCKHLFSHQLLSNTIRQHLFQC